MTNAEKKSGSLLPVINDKTGEQGFLDMSDPEVAKKVLQSMQEQPGDHDFTEDFEEYPS
jgi:hypothetical protein